MTSRIASRALLSKFLASCLVSRSSPSLAGRASLLRPLAATAFPQPSAAVATSTGLRFCSTRSTQTSLKDPSTNLSNPPPKESIPPVSDGCDHEHWLCVMQPPEDSNASRDDIIDSYIKTLAMVLGSEEEARMKIYSVGTKYYYAFGAQVSEEVSHKIKELPRVRCVVPDSYVDVEKKDYGGEPFINGEAIVYDKKYHEQWIMKNSRADVKNRPNDGPLTSEERGIMQAQAQNGPPPRICRVDPQTAICLLGSTTCQHLLCKTTCSYLLRRACLDIVCGINYPKTTIRYRPAKLSAPELPSIAR